MLFGPNSEGNLCDNARSASRFAPAMNSGVESIRTPLARSRTMVTKALSNSVALRTATDCILSPSHGPAISAAFSTGPCESVGVPRRQQHARAQELPPSKAKALHVRLGHHQGQPRDIATRMREAGDVAATDWVRVAHEYYGNR